MAVVALAYSIAAPMVTIEDYRFSLVLLTFQNVLKFLLIHFFLFGVMMSAMCKLIAESLMVKSDKKISSSGDTGGGFSQKVSGSDQHISNVEPMYAFDVHCNGFFTVVVYSYLV